MPKQMFFVVHYVTLRWNGAAAARACGYKAGNARQYASRLLTKANIQEAIKRVTARLLQPSKYGPAVMQVRHFGQVTFGRRTA